MSGVLPAAVAWPLLASVLLALPPRRVGATTIARAGLAASVLTLVLAGLGTLSPPAAGSRFWLEDRLAVSLALLVALPGVLAGLPALGPTANRVAAGGRARAAAVQLATGGAIAACRAGPVFLMLIGLAAMLAGTVLLLPRRPGPALPFAALLLTAWLGAAFLSAAGVPAQWNNPAAGVAAGAVPAACLLLLLLPMLLLAWLGPACCLAASARERALLPLLLAVPALGAALRLRGLSADPTLLQAGRLALCGGGVLMMLLSCALFTARRMLAERVVLAASVQLGAVAVGFGVGGTGGVVAGFMILGALILLLPVALLPAGRVGRIRLQGVAVLALAGMPPFGLFAADFVLLLRLFADSPALALLVLAGIGVTGFSLVDALRREPAVAAAPGATGVGQWLPGLVLLALLGWLGVAMPAPLADWLLGLSEATAGVASSAASVPR